MLRKDFSFSLLRVSCPKANTRLPPPHAEDGPVQFCGGRDYLILAPVGSLLVHRYKPPPAVLVLSVTEVIFGSYMACLFKSCFKTQGEEDCHFWTFSKCQQYALLFLMINMFYLKLSLNYLK